jgi:hypothetical protein
VDANARVFPISKFGVLRDQNIKGSTVSATSATTRIETWDIYHIAAAISATETPRHENLKLKKTRLGLWM